MAADMVTRVRYLSIAGCLAFASAGFAQYTMDLTGVGNGNSAEGVYVSPYTGSIWAGGYSGGGAPQTPALYSNGYLICDDFSDESFVGDVWNASATNAGNLNGSELFATSYSGYTVQQNYDAVAWLANQLLSGGNVNNATTQTDISFAIWDIMDGANPSLTANNPDGGAASWMSNAFTQVITDGYIGTNVTVFTPSAEPGCREQRIPGVPGSRRRAQWWTSGFCAGAVVGCAAGL